MPTALIVEDEPEANKLLGMLVRLRGFQIRSAFTGKEALRQVEAALPDVVFLDLMLPDLNGYEICRVLKSAKETSLLAWSTRIRRIKTAATPKKCARFRHFTCF